MAVTTEPGPGHTCPWGSKGIFPDCAACQEKLGARDKAVALRVLDDFEARIREQFKRVDPAWRQLLPILLREARHKYQEKP